MMKTSAFQTMLILGLGAGLGSMAALGGLGTARRALASDEPGSRSIVATTDRKACCSETTGRGGLLSVPPKARTSASTATAQAAKKPNIVIIWGDDIGQSNISAYTMGLMGYRTPNIDRVAKEGMIFTDYYAEQSCTAGRA